MQRQFTDSGSKIIFCSSANLDVVKKAMQESPTVIVGNLLNFCSKIYAKI